MVKKIANALRKGDIVVEGNGTLYEVVTAEHSMTGKRTACVQVYMKGVKQGDKEAPGNVRKRFMPDESVEVINLMEEECRFLYIEGGMAMVMRSPEKGCDQVALPVPEEVGPWLEEGMDISVYFDEERPVYFTLPKQLIRTVVSTEVSLRHQRATASYKPATLDNGMKIQVPSFVKDGDKVIIKTEDFSYEGRAKDDEKDE